MIAVSAVGKFDNIFMYRYNLLPTFPDLPGCNDSLVSAVGKFDNIFMYRYNLLPTFPDLPGCNDSSVCGG